MSNKLHYRTLANARFIWVGWVLNQVIKSGWSQPVQRCIHVRLWNWGL